MIHILQTGFFNFGIFESILFPILPIEYLNKRAIQVALFHKNSLKAGGPVPYKL